MRVVSRTGKRATTNAAAWAAVLASVCLAACATAGVAPAAPQVEAQDACAFGADLEEFAVTPAMRRCAEQGEPQAQAWLGMVYWAASDSVSGDFDVYGIDGPGWTVERLQAEGRRWLEAAAASGEPMSQNELGRAAMLGEFGTPIDYAVARRWLTLAAQNGDALAMFNIARMHHFGLGVPASASAAEDWLRRSAAAGGRSATCTLAALLDLRDTDAAREEARGLRRDVLKLASGGPCDPADMVEGFP